MAKKMDNVQFVKHMMEHSQAGALKQAFIIEAIRQYSRTVLASTEKWPDNYLISQESWKQCAEECIQEIDNRK
jgi:hypothetical protein